MANKKITELNEATSISNNDWLVMVDVANDETKKIHAGEVGGNIPIQDTAPASPEEDDLWIDTSEPEEMQEAIVNEYSTSTSDTYSCDYINDLLTYSTTEINTGKTWIDGKPIYRKVINVGSLPNASSIDISTDIFSAENKFITQIYCIGASNQGEFLKIPYYGDANNYVNIYVSSTHKIVIATGSDRSRFTGYVIVEYTKTTD